MNLTDMITLVRRDLRDESSPYQWSDDELTRHINRALKQLSERVPLPAKATLATTDGSREVSLTPLSNRVMVQAVEYPIDYTPQKFQRFALWGDTLVIISGNEPDGSNCYIYYGKLHTLDADTSTIPPRYEDLIATGACGYAAISYAAYSVNKVSVGGTVTPREYRLWGNERLKVFTDALKRLGRRQRIRTSQLYND